MHKEKSKISPPRNYLSIENTPRAASMVKPGFNIDEYIEVLKVTAQNCELGPHDEPMPIPKDSRQLYQSEAMGFDNMWSLWLKDGNIGVISIRGTTSETVSWLQNFYAAMSPAKGSIQLSHSQNFEYQLASHPEAAVHTGWLVGMAFLSYEIIPKVQNCIQQGIYDFIIVGHSQGGAIAYMLTSYLTHLRNEGHLNEKVRFKTYCSAAPKPGNLYYAYEFENQMQGGYAFNVVNTHDWVPQTPITIQILNDFNQENPFLNTNQFLEGQSLLMKMFLKHAIHELVGSPKQALRQYKKYLGLKIQGHIKEILPGFVPPKYYPSNNYVRTGHAILLDPNKSYLERLNNEEVDIWIHHNYSSYLHLAQNFKRNMNLPDQDGGGDLQETA